MARFVADASVTVTWCFEDEATSWSDALLARLKVSDEAIVPSHWPAEVSNTILMAVRRGRVSAEKASRFLEDLRALPIRVDPQSNENAFGRVSVVAAQHGLTVYDAAYLEIAMRMSLPLATLDEQLRKAARAAGVLLV